MTHAGKTEPYWDLPWPEGMHEKHEADWPSGLRTPEDRAFHDELEKTRKKNMGRLVAFATQLHPQTAGMTLRELEAYAERMGF